MTANGDLDKHQEQQAAQRSWQLAGASVTMATVLPALTRASEALLNGGRALGSIATQIDKLAADAARALSETTVLRQYLKNFTAREAETRRVADARVEALSDELAAVKGRLKTVTKAVAAKAKRRRRKRRA